MRESPFVKAICSALESSGAKTLKLHGHAMQAGGWPDVYVAHPAWRGWIETKVDDNELDPRQRSNADGLLSRGDRFVVVRLMNANQTIQIEGTEGELFEVLPLIDIQSGRKIFDALRKACQMGPYDSWR